jgi:hypothetical protein
MAITWNTTKTETGYTATVAKIGYQVPTEILKVATFSTRAKAAGYAKKWTLYFRRLRDAT